jgi:hypothetical protein
MLQRPTELLTAAVTRNRVVRSLDRLVDSAQPAVVFTGLARLLVPHLCDRCEIVLIEEGTPGYRIAFPNQHGPEPASTAGQADEDAAPQVLSTPIAGSSGPGRTFYGNLLCMWDRPHGPSSAEAAIAQLAVDHATSIVQYARLNNALEAAAIDATNLKVTLASNREIGIAVGILMGRNLVTREVAFDLLRAVSQDQNRKLRDVAANVAESGVLPSYTR